MLFVMVSHSHRFMHVLCDYAHHVQRVAQHRTAAAIPIAHTHTQISFLLTFFCCFVSLALFFLPETKIHNVSGGSTIVSIQAKHTAEHRAMRRGGLARRIATNALLPLLSLFFLFFSFRSLFSCFNFSIETIQCIIYRKLQTDELCIKCFCSINTLSHSVSGRTRANDSPEIITEILCWLKRVPKKKPEIFFPQDLAGD